MLDMDSLRLSALGTGPVQIGLHHPFMTLSFISLPTVPELGLTDMGLVDVLEHRLIPVEIPEK